MAQQTITEEGAFDKGAKDKINANFDDLYARVVALETPAYVDIGDVDTYSLLAANSGVLHGIPQVTGNIAIALPTPDAGLDFPIVFSGATAEGDNWVITATTDFVGGLTQVDTDGSAAAVISDGSSKNTLTVVAPLAGTSIRLTCDGTNWVASGVVCAVAVPTFAEV